MGKRSKVSSSSTSDSPSSKEKKLEAGWFYMGNGVGRRQSNDVTANKVAQAVAAGIGRCMDWSNLFCDLHWKMLQFFKLAFQCISLYTIQEVSVVFLNRF